VTKDRKWIDLAWSEANRAAELGPQLGAPHITLTLLNSGTGHYDEAIRQGRLAADLDPANDRAYAELARALMANNEPDAAKEMWRKAISLKPSYWGNYLRLGILYANASEYQEAVPLFTRVIQLLPDSPTAYTDLGSTYHYLGRDVEAEKMLKKSIEVRPTDLARLNLATVYFFEKRYAEAVAIYEKLVEGGTKDYGFWGNLADAYRWTPGRADKAPATYRHAVDLAREALDVNPRDVLARINLALYTAKTGQPDEALRNLDEVLKYAPNDKNILFNAAIVSELTGNRARALEFLGRAIQGGYSLNEIAAEPELGKLRQDPSYGAVVSRNRGH
jgi:serine/threonine-protein kinase